MTYVIEGTVLEVSIKKESKVMSDITQKNEPSKCEVVHTPEAKVIFCISGSIGFAIKQNGKNYNIFCPKEMPDNEKCNCGYIASQDMPLSVGIEYENLLIQAATSGKKIRLFLSEDALIKQFQQNTDTDSKETESIIITLLAN